MPLDPQDLLRQIESATPRLRESFSGLEANVDQALMLYWEAQAADWRATAQTTQARESLGYPYSELRQNIAVGEKPGSYTVVATDGSVIPPDRHNGSALYHVINTGRVMLRYGPDSQAEIDSKTQFYAGDVLDDEEQGSSGALIIDLKRDLQELKESLVFAQQHAADLAIMDGPLTMWNSRTLTDQTSKAMRTEYYSILGEFWKARIPIVGYISNTHSRGVTNSLRMLLNNQPQPTLFGMEIAAPPIRKSGSKGRERLGGLNGVHDAHLFRRLLTPGHHSEVFKTAFSEPKELAEYIGAVCFIYWQTEFEIVRLEFPEWIVEMDLLPRVTALVRDQYRLGQGYPVVLMEAHESAVLKTGDRELLSILLEERGLLQKQSEKGRSKQLRGV